MGRITGLILSSGGGGASTTTTLLDYSSDSGFSYTGTAIEFASGVAKLKNQYESDLLFAAKYSGAVVTADYGGGTLTGTTSGTVTVSGGKLNMDGADAAQKWTQYNSYLNFPVNGKGTLRLRATPGYTTNATTRQWIFFSALNILSSVCQFLVWHEANDTALQVQVLDVSGNSVCYMSGAWSPTAGVEYEIEVNFNAVDNQWALYVDGSRIATRSSGSGTGTLNHTNTFLRFGDANSSAAYFDMKLDDVAIYNTVKNTGATRTTGYSLPSTPYLTTDPKITQSTGVAGNSISAFLAGTTASGSDAVRFHILVGAQAKYWDGAAWSNSDGTYAQSNTEADINTNGSTIGAGTYKVVAVLHSNDGSTTPSVSSVSLVTT